MIFWVNPKFQNPQLLLGLSVLVVEDTVSWQFSTQIIIEMIVTLDWQFWFTSLRETLNNWRASNKGLPIRLDDWMIWHMKKDWRNQVYSARVEKAQRRTPNHSPWVAKGSYWELTEVVFSPGCKVTGQEVTSTSIFRGNSA